MSFNRLSRRAFLVAAGASTVLARYHLLAAAEKNKLKIRDVRTVPLQGPSRMYVCRTVFVGIGQGRAAGRFGNPNMHQTPQAAAQAVTNLAQRIGASQLAEQHGDELRPAGKALGGTLGG